MVQLPGGGVLPLGNPPAKLATAIAVTTAGDLDTSSRTQGVVDLDLGDSDTWSGATIDQVNEQAVAVGWAKETVNGGGTKLQAVMARFAY